MDKGFEMVTDLRGYYAPTGKVATFINFRGLFGLDMKPAEPVGTFLARVRDAESDLHEGGLDLDPVLINLFIPNGLSEKFHPIRQDFYIHGEKHGVLSVDEIEKKCVAYEKALEMDGSEEEFPPIKGASAGANGKDVAPPPPPPPPDPVDVPPTTAVVKELVRNAGTVCPLCRTRHPFTECFKCLGGGYVVTHAPEEAKAALAASNHRYHKPKASAASAVVPAIQPPTDRNVRFAAGATEIGAAATEVRAAAAELLVERDEASISSDEEGLVETGGIFLAQECAAARAMKPD